MANWQLIKKEYILGKTPRELAKKHKVTAQCISNRASDEQWRVERVKKEEEIANEFENQIQELTTLALTELSKILMDEGASYKDKNAAIKTVMDISGLKKESKDVKLSDGVEVVINMNPVKKVK